MNTHAFIPLRIALAAMLVAAAPAAHSQMYRWIDAQGSVMYSNQLPSDMSAIKDLTVVLEKPGTVTSSEKRGPLLAEPPRDATGDPADASNRAAKGDIPSAPAPRISIAPSAPEAVRDPCLRSSDPKCYERNRDAYIPYRGYSPSAARASKEAAAIGATSSAGAGGTIAGGSPAPAKLTPPPPSVYALPPGS